MLKISKGKELPPKKPLQEKEGNAEQPENHKPEKDKLLAAVQKELTEGSACDLVGLMLADPLLRELNLSLEKEAEQQKRQKLLESFPLRYQNLIHTELLYKKSQSQLKEYQRESREVIDLLGKEKEELADQVAFFKHSVQTKDAELLSLKEHHQLVLAHKEQEYTRAARTREQKDLSRVSVLERQLQKVRTEKEHSGQFLEELKEECITLKEENQRLVTLITEKDTTISELTSSLAQQEHNYHQTKQHFMTALVDAQLKHQQLLESGTAAKAEMDGLIAGLKARVRELQEEKWEEARQRQEVEAGYFDEMQGLRTQLLESLRVKNELQEEAEVLTEQLAAKEAERLAQIDQLGKQMQDQERVLLWNAQQAEAQIAKLNNSITEIATASQQNAQLFQEHLRDLQQQLHLQEERGTALQCQKLELDSELSQLRQQHQCLDQLYQQEKQQMEQIRQNKQVNIQKLAKEMEAQVQHFNSIVGEKEQKIGEYREEILLLRSQVKELRVGTQEWCWEVDRLREEAVRWQRDAETAKQKQAAFLARQRDLKEQIRRSFKEKSDGSCQCEAQEDESSCQALKRVEEELLKVQRKYLNAVEELQTLRSEQEEKEQLICHLQGEVAHLNHKLAQNTKEEKAVEELVDGKLGQLTAFYEERLGESKGKVAELIRTLKEEMLSLTQEIDLKAKIESQIYQDLLDLGQKEPDSS